MKLPPHALRRLLILRVMKADAEQVAEVISWGGDPNSRTKKGQPAIVRLVRNRTVMADVVEVLLRAGADPNARDPHGFTALDHARRRLAKYEGRPRKPLRRSPSLTPQGDVILHAEEHRFIEEMKAEHPERGDEFEMEYLESRRKAALRVFDNRGNLEKIVTLLEPVTVGK